MNLPCVAVVGGGLAGLAAAAELRRLGIAPVLFERDPTVGGVVRTVRRDGWLIDTGAAMAAEPAAPVRELLDAAGLGDCTVRAGAAGATRYIVLNGAPVLLPRTTSELTSSSLLSIAGRLRLLKERLIPAQRDTTDESVDSFARRRFGAEVAERMFDPLIGSTCAGDPKQILARFAVPGMVDQGGAGSALQRSARARMDARRRARGRPAGSWSCARGMQQLAERLAAWIGDVRVDATVDRIRATPAGIEITCAGRAAELFDAAIVAVPATAFGSMTFDVAESQRISAVSAIPHASVVAVSLGFRRDDITHPLDGARLLVPQVEGRAVLSMVFPSSLFPDRAPLGHVLVTAFAGGAFRPEMVNRSDAELVATVLEECTSLLGVSGAPVLSNVTRWPNALPQAVAGHGERLAAADGVERAESRIAFTGAWRDGLAVGEVLLGGVQAAGRLAAHLNWTGAPGTK